MAEFTKPSPDPQRFLSDIIIDAFGHDEAKLRQAFRDREHHFAEIYDGYHAAIHALAELTQKLQRLTRAYYALLHVFRQGRTR